LSASARAAADTQRLLVADLAATAPIWTLRPDGAAAIRNAMPAGWRTHVVTASTVSDGDGGAAPSAEAVDAIREAEVYFGYGISRPLFAEARRLRWVHSAAAGVGGALFAEMIASDVVLTNSAGVHAVPIAEHAVGGILHFLRAFDVAAERQRANTWDRETFVGVGSPMRELRGSRVLVLGAGGLGSEIARRCTAFGARCTGVRRRPDRGAPEGFERVVGAAALDTELRDADILVIAAPSTSVTRAIISRERLAMLPRHAIVVNVARGTLLDEEALADLLEAGALRGAVLDVTAREPLARESRLWQLRSVLLTPHVSAVSTGFWERELALFLENWRRYVAGEPLRNVVDKHEGY
jgi:phosphoglycerate dehydrogenase-like enzyme